MIKDEVYNSLYPDETCTFSLEGGSTEHNTARMKIFPAQGKKRRTRKITPLTAPGQVSIAMDFRTVRVLLLPFVMRPLNMTCSSIFIYLQQKCRFTHLEWMSIVSHSFFTYFSPFFFARSIFFSKLSPQNNPSVKNRHDCGGGCSFLVGFAIQDSKIQPNQSLHVKKKKKTRESVPQSYTHIWTCSEEGSLPPGGKRSRPKRYLMMFLFSAGDVCVCYDITGISRRRAW